MKKLRICYVNPPVLLKRPIAEIIDKMGEKGYKISLLIPKKLFKKRDESKYYSSMIKKSKIYTYSTINPPFLSIEQPIPATLMFPVNVFKALKENDIIHMWVPYYLTSLKIILIKKIFFPKKKLILTMDTIPGYSFSMGKFWDTMFKIYNTLFGWALFGTPKIITLYGKDLVKYAEKAGAKKEKIKVIPTGIEIKKAEKKDINVRKEFGIDAKTKIVLFVGMIMPRKGIDKIIKIANKLKKEKVIFLLAGEKRYGQEEYEKTIKKLNLEKKVLFLGQRKDIRRLCSEADVFLLPAEGEGLPGVIMEAMTFGVPCVASNIPCITDLVEHGKTGFLCHPKNINDFTDKVKMIIKNDTLKDKLGKAGLKKIKEFDWKKIIVKYEKLYQDP
ncbi:MAG: glycosyltransferase family 4 protein, partial [Nanoarchaeota archaeon]|nr:glycosyltransferase family 4 protein [Nanoarchaeota archaeon]MBU1597794.1 glycosyltransferase family 4 protein [Nanoarchaeota archaeon]MBU2441245.1 glycosyltransferase family 4 protein [Nanoarchaeota archaeon]